MAGAFIPPLIAVAGPFHRLRAGAGVLVAVLAPATTYSGLTVTDLVARGRVVFFAAIPAPWNAPEEEPPPSRSRPRGPQVKVTPAELACTLDGCDADIRIVSTGRVPLKIGEIGFEDGNGKHFEIDRSCVGMVLRKGEECAFTLAYTTPPASGETVHAQLVIHQSVIDPPLPSYVDVTATGAPSPPSDLSPDVEQEPQQPTDEPISNSSLEDPPSDGLVFE